MLNALREWDTVRLIPLNVSYWQHLAGLGESSNGNGRYGITWHDGLPPFKDAFEYV